MDRAMPAFPSLLSPQWLLEERLPQIAWYSFTSCPDQWRLWGEEKAFGVRGGLHNYQLLAFPFLELGSWGSSTEPQHAPGRSCRGGAPQVCKGGKQTI